MQEEIYRYTPVYSTLIPSKNHIIYKHKKEGTSMKKIWIASVAAAAIIMTGCGRSSNHNGGQDGHTGKLPEGLTFIMFDNVSGDQYSYNTEHDKFENMNVEGKNYNMTGKNGKLVVWTDHMNVNGAETEEQKIVMLNHDYNILIDGNVTHEKFHYIGHFHGEEFAAHSADEFDPALEINATKMAKKQATLDSLNKHLLEQEEIREELEEALLTVHATGDLCNFIVFGAHEEHGEEGHEEHAHEEHGSPHIAVTRDGYVYVFEALGEKGLVQEGVHFLLDGVTNCQENESDIMQIGENGVAIFSAETQKIYLVDKHGEDADFHLHTTVEMDELMTAGFRPTSVAAIGEGEHDHDHDH